MELADAARARRLAEAGNARPVIERRTGRLVGVDLEDLGMSPGPALKGNSLKYSYDYETEENPHGVWALKRIPTSAGRIFRTVLNECRAA